MSLAELHSHTLYCDGKNTPEEMILAAIKKGLDTYGFSEHGYTFFDQSYCLSPEKTVEYENEIRRLKDKYKGQINILLGVEQDVFSDTEPVGYDYKIGSVHYIKNGDEYRAIDESPIDFQRICEDWFDGDSYSLAEAYYAEVALLAEKKPDIIGHFDLVTKFNEGGKLFDMYHPRYLAAAKRAIDTLLPLGVPFEINTGAISRGYRSEPYPERSLIDYIKKNGGHLILTSDTHSAENICFQFDIWDYLI